MTRTMVKAGLYAAAGLLAFPAAAATFVFEGEAVSAVFAPKFDGALGTLNSVTFENSFNTQHFFGPFETTPIVHVVGTIGFAGLGFAAVDQYVQTTPAGDYLGTPLIGLTVRVNVKQTYTGDLAAYYAGGTGFGGVPYLYIGDGGNQTFELANGTVLHDAVVGVNNSGPHTRITFEYTPASFVPEPSTWAMLLVGFGMIGHLLRRRRTSVIFA